MTGPAGALLVATAAASTTMIGWMLAATRRSWPAPAFGATLLVAGAGMIAISAVELLPTAADSGTSPAVVAAWFSAGLAAVLIARMISAQFGSGSAGMAQGAWFVAIAIALHNLPEGAATATAALVSWETGIATAVGVGLHNIPEGLAVAVAAMAAGLPRSRTALLVGVATLGEILGALLAVGFAGVRTDMPAGPLLALAAGIMVMLSVTELLPSGARLLRSRGEMGASGIPPQARQPSRPHSASRIPAR